MRHLDVGALWLQKQALRRAVELMKVKGTSNPADLMTKHLAREQVEQYAEALNLDCRDGHADRAVKLRSTQQKHWETHTRHDAEPNTDNDDSDQRDAERPTETTVATDSTATRTFARGALSQAREALRGATEGAASRRSRDAERPRRRQS